MFCQVCGNRLPNDAIFCNVCGRRQEVSGPSGQPSSNGITNTDATNYPPPFSLSQPPGGLAAPSPSSPGWEQTQRVTGDQAPQQPVSLWDQTQQSSSPSWMPPQHNSSPLWPPAQQVSS